MNRYEGVKCPVCGKPFTADDEVTVCPVCGTPHHAACYREAGQCAHEDWHASGRKFVLSEKRADGAARASEGTSGASDTRGEQDTQERQSGAGRVSCPRCGNPCEPDAMFCQRCGFPVGQFRARQQQNPYEPRQAGQPGVQFVYGGMVPPYAGLNPEEELTEGVTVREYAAFIGPAAPQYLLRFKRMAERGKTISWNFLFGIGNAFYLCYRKVYKIGIPLLVYLGLYIGVYLTSTIMTMQSVYAQIALDSSVTMDTIYAMMETAMAALPPWLLNAFVAMRFTILPIMLILALFGDKIYFSHCTEKILALKKDNPGAGAEEIAALAGKKGGVNRRIMTVLMTLALLAFMVVPFMTTFLIR